MLAGLNGLKSQIAAKPTPNAYVVSTWKSGSSWYRKWSDGWIEQGGAYSSTVKNDQLYTVSLHTPFTTATYSKVVGMNRDNETSGWGYGVAVSYANATTNSFKFNPCTTSGGGSRVHQTGYAWYACGY